MSETTLLDHIAIFAELEPATRELLTPLFTRCQATAGTTIFTQNAPADCFFILLTGEVLIRFKPYDGEELTVSRILPGGIFGWSAVLGNPHYTASAISENACQMVSMRGADLHRLCHDQPAIGSQILGVLASAAGENYSNAHTQVIALLEYGVCNSDETRRKQHGNASR
jgi:CRP-like cAMP-binding protein